ncbi:ATP-binding protein [Arcicella sp. LKC2W]|uniref:ATP-binding protein n=1 Tax=Arcicella sp. LKC2W TaxID=2984198 RepID=UPI002B1FC55B|nr:ATP-binding protein [Arcicella sp. LKC2W]MEA5458560.1 ATP-binding protein [Arcicella sp. LKC2W]
MDDILLLADKVRNTLILGESHFREFKSALEGRPDNKKQRLTKLICADIGEALVSFSNADGGAILVGVEDDGTITGIPHSEEDIQIMLNSIHTHVYQGQQLPLNNANKLVLDHKTILYFSVNKGTTMIYQLPDGRCVRRKDKSTMPASVDQIQFERQEIKSREYDSQFVDGANVTDLDVRLLQGIADQYIKGLSIERYLQQIGLAEYAQNGLRLKRAALLLFATDIDRWHPRSQVRFLKVKGNTLEAGEKYNVVSDDTVKGNIFELVIKSWEHLRSSLAYKTEFGTNSQFEQKYIYPEDAVREAILNAIAHRDYSIANAIEIYIFNDRMEIKSPGALISTLTVKNLYELEGSHESRNSLIARVLRENKLMRELGEGMKRIFTLMHEQELEKPELYSNGLWFRVTLSNKTIFSTKQVEWLLQFDNFNLSKNQKKIVLLGLGDKQISSNDIFKALNISNTETEKFTQEVTVLRTKGILTELMTSQQAYNVAKKLKKNKKDVPRYKVRLP